MTGEARRSWLGAALLLVAFVASGALWSQVPELPFWNRLELPAAHALIRLAVVVVSHGWD